MKRLLFVLAVMSGLVVAAPGVAAAAYTLSGTATIQGDNVRLVSDFSDTTAANDFGLVSFTCLPVRLSGR